MNTHTETKHTPGPWSAFRYPDCKTWTVASDRSIASRIEREEDARLIAATPELLDQLAKAADQLEAATRDLRVLNEALNHYVRQPTPSVIGLRQLLALGGTVSNNCERVAIQSKAAITKTTGGQQ